jgi:PAS domain S-box-containing protein
MKNIFKYEDLLTVISSFLNETKDGVIIIDVERRLLPIVYVNKGFTNITGYDSNDVISKNLSDILCGGIDKSPNKEILENLIYQRPFSNSLTFVTKEGKLREGFFSFTPVEHLGKGLKYYIIIVEDITEKKLQIEHEATVRGMKATIATINDLLFNYMTYLKIFHEDLLELNGSLKNERLAELMNEFNSQYRKTFKLLSKICSMKTFNTKELSNDFEMLDI